MSSEIILLATARERWTLSITYLHDFNCAPVKSLSTLIEDAVAVIVHQREGSLWVMYSSILPCPHQMTAMGPVIRGDSPPRLGIDKTSHMLEIIAIQLQGSVDPDFRYVYQFLIYQWIILLLDNLDGPEAIGGPSVFSDEAVYRLVPFP